MEYNVGKIHSAISFVVLFLSITGQVKTDILTQFFTGSRNEKTGVRQTQATNFIHGIQVKQSDVLQDYINILLHKNPSKLKQTTQGTLYVSTTTSQNSLYVSPTTRRPAFTGKRSFQLNRQKNLDRIRKLMSQDKGSSRQNGKVFFRQSPRLQLQRTTPSSISGMFTTVPLTKAKKSFRFRSKQTSQRTSNRNSYTKDTERLTTQHPPPPIILKQTVKTRTIDTTKHTSGKAPRVQEVEIYPSAIVKVQQHSKTEFVTDKINEETTAFEHTTKSSRLENKSENPVTTTLTSQQPLLKATVTSTPTIASVSLKVTAGVSINDAPLSSTLERIKDNGTVISTLAVMFNKQNRGSVNFEVSDTVKKNTLFPSVIVHDQSPTNVANGVKKTGNTALRQTTRIVEPLMMTSSLRIDRYDNNRSSTTEMYTKRYDNNRSTTTEMYTKQTSIQNQNDKVEQATKVLVSDSSNPILDHFKSPSFWLVLNDKNTAADTKPKINTSCTEMCKAFENVCKNGGTCVNTCTGFMCACAPGFDGYFCDKIKTSKNTTLSGLR